MQKLYTKCQKSTNNSETCTKNATNIRNQWQKHKKWQYVWIANATKTYNKCQNNLQTTKCTNNKKHTQQMTNTSKNEKNNML